MKLSVIIPARNEFPNIVHTVYSIIHSLEAEGFTYKDFEIIIVDNCSNDDVYPQKGTAGTTSYLETRGGYFNGIIKVLRFPIAGNHTARNKGAEIARGEYLFFSDGHMAYRPGFFKNILKTVDESGGLVHGAIAWMGAYPPVVGSTGFSYTIKLGEEIKGTWNPYYLTDNWWYIPSQGHCSLAVRKDQFLKFGGYPSIHRTYGGGEFYIDMKWWLFGSNAVVNPNCVGYHLSAARNYTYRHENYIENVLGCAYALGCDDWRERTYINALRHKSKEVLDMILERNEKEYAKDREFFEKMKKTTFNQLLLDRPWDKLNEEKYGKANGAMLIYHWTWMDLLLQNPVALEAYKNSKYQKDLDKFIEENLRSFVYKDNEFSEDRIKDIRNKIYA